MSSILDLYMCIPISLDTADMLWATIGGNQTIMGTTGRSDTHKLYKCLGQGHYLSSSTVISVELESDRLIKEATAIVLTTSESVIDNILYIPASEFKKGTQCRDLFPNSIEDRRGAMSSSNGEIVFEVHIKLVDEV